MTVKELRKELKKYDKNTVIFIDAPNESYIPEVREGFVGPHHNIAVVYISAFPDNEVDPNEFT